MATSVQIVGIDNVINSYRYLAEGTPSFAVWQGKAMNFKYDGDSVEEGAEMLREMLRMYSSATQAIYTLRVYDSSDPIKSNTPDVGGFNFKINDEAYLPSYNRVSGVDKELLSRVEALEKIGKPAEESEGLPKWLDHPIVIGVISKMLGVSPASITGVGGSGGSDLSDADNDKLDKIIDGLLEADDNLVFHLEKLLKIAKSNPGQFQMMLKMLENY